ncbi:MAG TPA: hypothetical protein VII40_21310 [Xanthobacteraceae bacterium]|jgi:hypothetical protein
MIDANAIQPLVQVSQASWNLSLAARQIELARLWADELAKPRHADPKRLLRYGFKVYSQADEDGIIQEIFRRIGTTNRTFVEFGVEAGVECNTAKLLLDGWNGLWIEAAPPYAAAIRNNARSYIEGGQLKLIESLVTAESINKLIASAGLGGEIDLLSIDIDNNDYWVWKAIDAVKPRVVVIEYNPTLRPPLSLVVPYRPDAQWDGTNYFGASLEALVRLARAKDYRVVGCNISGGNAFFVRNDQGVGAFLEPATAEEHFEPARYYFAMLNGGHRPRLGPYVAV